MNRRRFLTQSAALGVVSCFASPRLFAAGLGDIDDFIESKMRRDHMPGLAACIIKHDEVVWSKAYGWADIERRIPYSLDSLQNIASISKTFTTTAIMQLKEVGLLSLDSDLNSILPFPVSNPKRSSDGITIRQLLTHTSYLRDGLFYSQHYACGDPRFELATWLREYLTPGGAYYNAEENFQDWEPGSRWEYTNITFGVLAYVVELVSAMPFAEYCRRNIFSRLAMLNTSWMLADVDLSQHVVPYTWVEDGVARGPSWGGVPLGVIREGGPTLEQQLDEGYQGNCAYNHPNYPDGFLRTSVRQLSNYARAYLNGGEFDGRQILEPETVNEMLSNQRVPSGNRTQGLTWSADRELNGEPQWGHGGSDPGSNTDIRILPEQGIAAIVFTNTNGVTPTEVSNRLLEIGDELY